MLSDAGSQAQRLFRGGLHVQCEFLLDFVILAVCPQQKLGVADVLLPPAGPETVAGDRRKRVLWQRPLCYRPAHPWIGLARTLEEPLYEIPPIHDHADGRAETLIVERLPPHEKTHPK